MKDVNYRVPTYNEPGKNKIRTLYNTSPLYVLKRLYDRIRVGRPVLTDPVVCNVLTDVNLVLRPGKMYLVLGPPLSGKTSLLKAVAGMLPQVSTIHAIEHSETMAVHHVGVAYLARSN